MDLDRLATQTCSTFLTAPHLKMLCRLRGFTPTRPGKEGLAACASARLLETAGVREAMGSLDELGLVLLHRLAMSPEPVRFSDLKRVVCSAQQAPASQDRAVFDVILERLVTRGSVLIADSQARTSSYESRYTRLSFVLLEEHRPLVPPFPLPARPLGDGATSARPLDVCRKALMLAVLQAKRPAAGKPATTLHRLAAKVSFAEGQLSLAGSHSWDAARLSAWVRQTWADGWPAPAKRRYTHPFQSSLRAAAHLLAGVPSGHGLTLSALGTGLDKLGLGLETEDLAPFLVDGADCGFLARGGPALQPVYAASVPELEDRALAFETVPDGIRIDLETTGLPPLVELAAVCRATPDEACLTLRPDLAKLGRAWPHFQDSPILTAVAKRSPAFAGAVEHVRARHGRLLLHEGLLVIRAEDLGFRTLVLAKLGDAVRSLGGAFLALPAGLAREVETLARKEGFAPRRLS
jgi:hypothetical protein